MAVQLSPRNQAWITELVEHGDFPDADTVVEQALDLLAERERFLELKAMIAVSVEQAQRGELFEYHEQFRQDAKRDALRRFAAGEVAGPDVRP